MRDLLLFVEDAAQENLRSALIRRMAAEAGVELQVRVRSQRGGSAKVLQSLEDFLGDVRQARESVPDGIVVAIDANCRGYLDRRREVDSRVNRAGAASTDVVYAIPNPHIERWFLLDGEAFKTVVGKGCRAPDEKCEKARYKRLLNAAVTEAGVQPLLGGVEYARELAAEYPIQRVADTDEPFGRFVSELRGWLNRQRHGG